MVVKLRLKRFGRVNHPTYRLCATDARSPRDGRIIETLGYYLPKAKRAEDQCNLKAERVSYWLSVGAQPSETVASLIRKAGIASPEPAKRKPKTKSKAKPKPFVPPRRKKKAKKAPEAAAAQAAAPAAESAEPAAESES